MEYSHLRRVSDREDETKQELSQPRILRKDERFMLEMRCVVAFMQDLEERCAQFQNEMNSVKILTTKAKVQLLRFQNVVDIIPAIVEVDDEQPAPSQMRWIQ
jgi:hypothetical protein